MSVTVRLVGDIDLAAQDQVLALLEPAACRAAHAGEDLVVDLDEVTFLDSTGIACLVRARRQLRDGASLVLTRPSEAVRRVLEISGLGELCRIDDRSDGDERG